MPWSIEISQSNPSARTLSNEMMKLRTSLSLGFDDLELDVTLYSICELELGIIHALAPHVVDAAPHFIDILQGKHVAANESRTCMNVPFE
jgi:hypothetical protein